MKPRSDINRGCWTVTKGKTTLDIFPGCDRPFAINPRIVFEGHSYEVKNHGLIEIIKGFENTYTEEQVLEKLIEFTC